MSNKFIHCQFQGGTSPVGAKETGADVKNVTVAEKKGFRNFFSGTKSKKENTTDQGESSEYDYSLVPNMTSGAGIDLVYIIFDYIRKERSTRFCGRGSKNRGKNPHF